MTWEQAVRGALISTALQGTRYRVKKYGRSGWLSLPSGQPYEATPVERIAALNAVFDLRIRL